MTNKQLNISCHFFVVILLSLSCATIYSNTLHSPFVFDDLPNIVNNNSVKLDNIETSKIYDAAFNNPNKHRPIPYFSFALNHYFNKDNVFGYHLFNIVVHIINGVLVYLITLLTLQRLNSSATKNSNDEDKILIIFSSAIAALFFVVHPLQIQSVTYIVQRMNSLATMFYFLSILCFISGRLRKNRRNRLILYFFSFISGLFAMGSKEIAATLPIIIFLYEWYFFQDVKKKWITKNKKILFGVVILLLVVFVFFLGLEPFQRIMSDYKIREFTMVERLLTEFRVIVFYISLIIMPAPSRLNLLHDFSLSYSLLDPVSTLFSLLLISTLIILSIFLLRKQKVISFCILWFFINLVIESSIIGLELVFEHRLYLPMFSFSLLIGFLAFHCYKKKLRLLVLSGLFVILVLGMTTYSRNEVWKNEITLWNDVLNKNPGSYRAHYNLGNAYKDQGLIDEAIKQYETTIFIRPTHIKAFNNLGNAHKQKGSLDEALYYYEKALEISKDDPVTHYNLGNLMLFTGDLDKATYYYKQAINIEPRYSRAYNNLGIVMAKQNKTDEALLYFTKANQFEPEYVDALLNLARAHWLNSNIDVACNFYRQILLIEPEYIIPQRENLKICKIQELVK